MSSYLSLNESISTAGAIQVGGSNEKVIIQRSDEHCRRKRKNFEERAKPFL